MQSGRGSVCRVGGVLCAEREEFCVQSGRSSVCRVGGVLCVEWEEFCVLSGRGLVFLSLAQHML